jgi:hypothetical protein
MRVLKWLTKREFSQLDLIWIAWTALALRDGLYFAAFIAAFGGSAVSAWLQKIAQRRSEATP